MVIRSVKSGEERLLKVPGIAKSDPSRQISDRLQWFPDNRSLLLYYGSGELYRFDTQTGQSQRLLETVKIPWYINATPNCPPGCAQNGWATSLVLAPDGRTIFYRNPASRNRMMRRDLNGGTEQEVCRLNAPHINNFALSADGTTLALIGVGSWDAGDRAIMTVSASGGEPKEIYRSGKADVARDLAWSRDGRYLIFSMPKFDNRFVGDLFSIPSEGGRPQPLGIQLSPYDFLNISPDGRHLIFMGKSQRNEKKELWVMKVPQR